LRSTEQQVLLSAVQFYLDVVRDMAIVALRENNVKVLAEQLRATENRFQVGEVTKTDVAQSRASLSGGQSDVAFSRATLQVSRANFERVIGHPPSHLIAPDPVDNILPNSLEYALKVGEAENPMLISAIYRERAQDHTIEQTRGELLPQLSLQANYTAAFNPAHGLKEEDIGIITGRLTVPLYQSGEVGARIRQGVETRSQLRQEIDQARQQVTANVVSAWSQVVSIRSQIVANKAQVDANTIALAGVREEEKVGQRTVLDVLNAQQALLISQVTLETSKHDLGVATHALLASIGRLTAGELGLSVALYDPSRHYNEVKDKWSDWDWSAHSDLSSRTDWSTNLEATDEPEVGPLGVPAKGPPTPDGPAYQQWTASFE
jgi:outer membrane protein